MRTPSSHYIAQKKITMEEINQRLSAIETELKSILNFLVQFGNVNANNFSTLNKRVDDKIHDAVNEIKRELKKAR